MAAPAAGQTRPMVTFVDAVQQAFRKYGDFSGRATRAEYWWWVLFTIIAGLAFGAVDGFIASVIKDAYGPFGAIFNLAVLLPGLAVAARRLHDIGKTGWWLLAWYGIPVLVWIIAGALWGIAIALAGEDGRWEFLAFLPAIIASIAALVVTLAVVVWAVIWMVRQGETGPNRFGPDPRALDAPELPEGA